MFARKLATLLVMAPLTQKYKLETYKFHHGTAMIPHPRKLKRGGEDAVFATDTRLGVFDGVSAWMEEDGIDAGIFAFALSVYSQDVTTAPSEILEEAFKKTTVLGAATACLITLTDTQLQTCNLGDSGFILLRRLPTLRPRPNRTNSWYNFLLGIPQESPLENAYCVYEKSTPMMHDDENNIPFQLASSNTDHPLDAQTTIIEAQLGDIIVMATDGLFDNLSEAEIVAYVNNFDLDDIAAPKHLAWKLAYKAQQKYDVVDDISVVVAKVVST